MMGMMKQRSPVSLLRLGSGCSRDRAAPVAILRKVFAARAREERPEFCRPLLPHLDAYSHSNGATFDLSVFGYLDGKLLRKNDIVRETTLR